MKQSATTCCSGRRLSAQLALAITFAFAPAARAQFASDADVQAAARAFQAAQRAQLTGDASEAARLYELADSIAPAPEALRSAIRAHVTAEQPARAATLALAAQRRYPEDAESLALSSEILAQQAPALGRVRVRCESACALLCDGHALQTEPATELEFFVAAGAHAIEARFDGTGTRAETLELAAGETRELSFAAPPPAPTAPAAALLPGPSAAARSVAQPKSVEAENESSLDPLWFWTAAGLTAVSGAAAVIAGLDTLDKQEAYELAPTRAGYDAGKDSQLRTNLLIGSTAALLVASGVLLAFTDFEDDDAEHVSPSLAATPHSAVLLLRRSFR